MSARRAALAVLAALAVAPVASLGAKAPADKPRVLEILNADQWEHEEGRTVLSGHVHVRTEEWDLQCAALTYDDEAGTVTGDGPLTFTRDTLVLTASRLTGDLSADRVTFTEKVTIIATPKPKPADAKPDAASKKPDPLDLRCDRLDYDGAAKQATASGHLEFSYRDLKGTAGEMVYDLNADRAEFRGEPAPTITRADGAQQVAKRVRVELSAGRLFAEQVHGQLPITDHHEPPKE